MTRLDITVRQAEQSDAAGMATAHVLAWQVGYAGLVPDDYLRSLDPVERGSRWHRYLAEGDPPKTPDGPGSIELVATVDAVAGADGDDATPGITVAGIASYGSYRSPDGAKHPELCELRMLNVHPDYWGSGVAQALMAKIVDRLRSARAEPTAALWVLADNGRGRRFYEKSGWQPDGSEKRDEVGGTLLREVRYTRAL